MSSSLAASSHTPATESHDTPHSHTPLIQPSSHISPSSPQLSSAELFNRLSPFARNYTTLKQVREKAASIPSFFHARQDHHTDLMKSYQRYNHIVHKNAASISLPRSLTLRFVEQFQFPCDINSPMWDDYKKRLRELETNTTTALHTLLKETKEKGLAKRGLEASKPVMIKDMVLQFEELLNSDKSILEQGLSSEIDHSLTSLHTHSYPTSPEAATTLTNDVKKTMEELKNYFTALVTEEIGALHLNWIVRKDTERKLAEQTKAAYLAAQARIIGEPAKITLRELSKKTTTEALGPITRDVQQLKQQHRAIKQQLPWKRNASQLFEEHSSQANSNDTNDDVVDITNEMDNHEEIKHITQTAYHKSKARVHHAAADSSYTSSTQLASSQHHHNAEHHSRNIKVKEVPRKKVRFATIVHSSKPFNGLPYRTSNRQAQSIADLNDDEMNEAYDSFERHRSSASSSSSSSNHLNSKGGDRSDKNHR